MIAEDQASVVSFLSSPEAHGGAPVERIDTHTAVVFLTGERAFKLKRAVRFDYVDFSTVDRRQAFCDAELRLNRRTAPTLYRRVVAVTREAGGALAVGGEGPPVDWLVEMNRFQQADLFDRLAASGQLALEWMIGLADAIADFHLAAERRPDHGGRAGMSWVVEGNAAGFAEFGDVLDPATAARVTEASLRAIAIHAELLERRRQHGSVRHCHGDLHLRNIVRLDGKPTLFDGVEFNDEIACTDVLYDLAFLLMDLWRRQLPLHANAVWNRYLSRTDDVEGLPLIPLFLSCRAAVRAKTSATAAAVQRDSTQRGELGRLARDYLSMAASLLDPPPPRLVAIGGFSGSGKSSVAQRVAAGVGSVPGAIVIRSDELRKQLCGVPPLAPLGPEGYAPSVSARVYDAIAQRARAVLAAGHGVVVDAVLARPSNREAIEEVARDLSVAFTGLWVDASETTLVSRVAARRRDPSDADPSVVRAQMAAGSGPIRWQRLDGERPLDAVVDDARRLLESG